MIGILPAALCAGLAAWVVLPDRAQAVKSRLGAARGRRTPALWFGIAALAAVVYAAGPVAALLAGVLAGIAWFVRHRVLAHRRRGRHEERIAQAAEAVDALAAELAAGAAPVLALARVGRGTPVLTTARSAAELGGDVPEALRSAESPARPLVDLAAAWEVADRTGAPLVEVLDGIAAHLAAERETRRQIAASLAPARATGHTLAFLPVFGVALGTAMGHAPMQFLTQTMAGALLLAAGSALACTGVWWVDRVVDAAQESP